VARHIVELLRFDFVPSYDGVELLRNAGSSTEERGKREKGNVWGLKKQDVSKVRSSFHIREA